MNPTPHRTIRVPDELWIPFRDQAKAQDKDASVIIRAFIAQWLEDHKEQP